METCSIPGCGKVPRGRGLCGAHYEVERRAGRIPPRWDRKVCAVEGCVKMAVGHGHCDLHYHRLRRTGSVDGRQKPTAEVRFWSFVRKGAEDECWPWTGGGWPTGYGSLRMGRGKVAAHRFSYELHVGPIPKGLVIDHLCRNRCCVNPQHLEAVTFKENILRGEGTGAHHARKTHCLRGHSFDPPNGYTNKHGHRLCRACDAIRYAARRARVGQLGA